MSRKLNIVFLVNITSCPQVGLKTCIDRLPFVLELI